MKEIRFSKRSSRRIFERITMYGRGFIRVLRCLLKRSPCGLTFCLCHTRWTFKIPVVTTRTCTAIHVLYVAINNSLTTLITGLESGWQLTERQTTWDVGGMTFILCWPCPVMLCDIFNLYYILSDCKRDMRKEELSPRALTLKMATGCINSSQASTYH